MGIRGEIFTKSIQLPNRTYFFNVKENRMGDIYLNIVESKNRETGGFDRQSVILFADDLQEFLKGFDESLRVLEKTAREKKRAGKEDGGRPAAKPEQDGRPRKKTVTRKPAAGSDRKPAGNGNKRQSRRVVVKKSTDNER